MPSSVRHPGRQLPPPEELLLDYVRSLARHRRGRIALHLRLSALTRAWRREHHLRAAEGPLRTVLAESEGQLFRLSCGDLVCAARTSRKALDAAVLKILYLMRDDTHLKAAIDAGEEDAFLCGWYDLETDYESFLAFARARIEDPAPAATLAPVPDTSTESPAPAERPPRGFVMIEPGRPAPEARPADAEALAKLERGLKGVVPERFLRGDDVVLFGEDGSIRPAMRTCGIDADALVAALLPGLEIASASWFRDRLESLLSLRLLAAEPQIDPADVPAVLLHLDSETLFAAAFDRFLAPLDRRRRNRIVVALAAASAMARPFDYHRAREKMTALGLRGALTGMDPLAFAMHDRRLLPAEFVILDWPALAAWRERGGPLYERISSSIGSADPARLVLAGCDGAAALDCGRELGIRLFQGSHLRNA